LSEESEIFERETRFIFDRLLDLVDGDAALAIVRGIESGFLDNPWGTHPSVACRVMGVRDAANAVRYYDTGNIPFPKEIRDWHMEKIANRSSKDGREVDYDNFVQDILSVGEGALLKRCEF
jgi:methylaspartate mutase epsilon subunit